MTNNSEQRISIKRFHNVDVEVIEKKIPLENIHYWKENNRTIFTFEQLIREKNKRLDALSVEEITEFLAGKDIHKLDELAEAIERNGVQVPLIVLKDGTLLDGNRRYFACQLIKMTNKKRPKFLDEIPVWEVSQDISQEVKLKILAEENFIKDLKLPWSLDAQARAVNDYYEELQSKKLDEEEIFSQLSGVFGITRQRVRDLLDTLKLTLSFIGEGKSEEERISRRVIVEEKFVYFWEFRNKSMKGNSKYSDSSELKEVVDIFFKLMAMGRDSPVKNVKQVEPLAQARRDKVAWMMLQEDNGSKLGTVVTIVNEKKENRRADDKIRAFSGWLEGINQLTDGARENLISLAKIIEEKLKG